MSDSSQSGHARRAKALIAILCALTLPPNVVSVDCLSASTHATPHHVQAHVLVVQRPTEIMMPTAKRHLAPVRLQTELVDDTSGNYNNDLTADARSTNTVDWSCIRNAESHDNYHQVSGAYGVLTESWQGLGMTGTPGQASVRVQDAFALRLFKLDGDRFGGSWHDECTMSEGLE